MKRTIPVIAFIIGFLLVARPPRLPPIPVDEDEQGGALKSFEWWYAQRAYPSEMIPRGAYRNAWTYLTTSMRKEQLPRTQRETAATVWNSLGPDNIGGRMLALAIDPTATNVIWAGAASGGLWKSTTAGEGLAAWSYVPTGFSALSVSAIAIDPSNRDIMYIGTGEISLYHRPLVGTPGARASYGMGVLESTDRGVSWNETGLQWTFPEITAVQRIVINPLNSRTLYAATSEGTFKSTNRGATWSQTHAVLMAMDLVMNPADTSTLIVACGSFNSSADPGLYRTTNAGTTWTKLAGGLPGVNFGRTSLGVSAADSMTVYAGISDAASLATIGLYKSTDGGNNWTAVSDVNYVGTQGWYNNVIAAHPQGPDTVFCGGIDIYKSTAGGSNLTNISSAWVHVDQHAIAFDPSNPSVMYFGCDGGVFKSTDGGRTFLDCNKGLITTQFYPGFANSPVNASRALGGLQDNGSLKYIGISSWAPVLGADGGWCAIDPSADSVMYAEEQNLKIYKSVNTGGSFFPINNNLPSTPSNTNFIAPFVISPSSPSVLYAGLKTVYKTTNGGNSWFPTNGGNNFNGTNVACIGVSWTNPDTLLAATGTGSLGETPIFQVFSSTNGGVSWVNVTDSLPNRYPTHIEFDPTQSASAFITYSGYGTPHVFNTTNLGGNWTNSSANLPDNPHQALTVDPDDPQQLYVGTDLGVFHSSNRGADWEEFSAGMPPAMVLDLSISRNNGRLRAATFGNGVYERKLVRTPTLALTSPNGGEFWVAGLPESILWSERNLDFVKLEYSSDNGVTWNLITPQAAAAPQRYDWTLPLIATTQARVRISDATDALLADSSHAPFTILSDPDVVPGWNILSLPFEVTDCRKTTLYPAAVSDAYEYRGTYLPLDSIHSGIGYWIKFTDAQVLSFSGTPITTDTVPVRAGWNIIGSVAADIDTSLIQQIPTGIIASSYFGFQTGGYLPVTTIRHEHGFWVKARSSGQLVLAGTRTLQAKKETTPPAAPPWNDIILTDARGYRQTLYFTASGDTSLASRYELPPPGPACVFDARFSNQGMLVTLAGTPPLTPEELPILLRGGEYPLSIHWHIKEDGRRTWSILIGGDRSCQLAGEGSILLEEATGQLLIRAEGPTPGAVPQAARLYENYPNPFNPSTTIRYSLPQRAKVLMTVYDVRGQLVATLAAGEQEAGIHSVQWDATGRASGLYFVRLTEFSPPGGVFYTGVQKLLLLR